MKIIVNGIDRSLDAPTSLGDLVAGLARDRARGVAVAVNGAIVPRGTWASTRLASGDRIEILTASQGG